MCVFTPMYVRMVWVCAHVRIYLWRSKANLWNLILSFYHIGPRDLTPQFVKLDRKIFHSLSHLTGPWILFIYLVACIWARDQAQRLAEVRRAIFMQTTAPIPVHIFFTKRQRHFIKGETFKQTVKISIYPHTKLISIQTLYKNQTPSK